jgi:hypothetical protein
VSVKAEYLAVDALASWLRLKLPAKVTEINALRAAALRTPSSGNFTIPSGAVLKVSLSGKDGPYTSCPLTSGPRTTTEVVDDINDSLAIAATDGDSRAVLTSTTTPSAGTPSVVSVGPDSTGANLALGWEAGGEYVINTGLVGPGHRGVMDGWPQQLDAKNSFLVIIGKRSGLPVAPELRRDETVVTMDLSIFRPASQQENHRSREHIHACVQCVREVLMTDAGRQLGRASTGDIVLVEMGRCSVEGMRFQQYRQGQMFGPSFDSASLTVYAKVFERPSAS